MYVGVVLSRPIYNANIAVQRSVQWCAVQCSAVLQLFSGYVYFALQRLYSTCVPRAGEAFEERAELTEQKIIILRLSCKTSKNVRKAASLVPLLGALWFSV